jgi:hypothetical protein
MSRHSFLERSLMKSNHFSVLIFLLALTACKKEKDLSPAPQTPATIITSPTPSTSTAPPVHDTIRPTPYFPAFPGSWWKYENQQGIYTDHTEQTYQKDWYSYYDHNTPYVPHNTDTAYVPIYVSGTSRRAIWGSRERKHTTYDGTRLFTIINDSLALGAEWTFYYAQTHMSTRGRLLTKDTTITGKGKTFEHVMRVGYYTYNLYAQNPILWWDYFAKDIGLVRTETSADTTWLVDYYINKP